MQLGASCALYINAWHIYTMCVQALLHRVTTQYPFIHSRLVGDVVVPVLVTYLVYSKEVTFTTLHPVALTMEQLHFT